MIPASKYSGCFLGLATGDALGAVYEGGIIERLVWALIGKTRSGRHRYTDDTQMSIDLAHSILTNNALDQNHLAMTFALSYQWSRGYGPQAAKLLKKIRRGANWQKANRAKFKDGSYGNGAAMRAPILALCFANQPEQLNKNIIKASEITHANPLAIEGARLIALTTRAALLEQSRDEILKQLPQWCESTVYKNKVDYCIESLIKNTSHHKKDIKKHLGNGIAAHESSVTAIYFALAYHSLSFDSMLLNICQLGGDTDTIAAMAGAIWGTLNGIEAFNQNCLESIENSEYLLELSQKLYTLANHVESKPG